MFSYPKGQSAFGANLSVEEAAVRRAAINGIGGKTGGAGDSLWFTDFYFETASQYWWGVMPVFNPQGWWEMPMSEFLPNLTLTGQLDPRPETTTFKPIYVRYDNKVSVYDIVGSKPLTFADYDYQVRGSRSGRDASWA